MKKMRFVDSTIALAWALRRLGAEAQIEPTHWAALLIAISGLTAAHANVMRKFYRESDRPKTHEADSAQAEPASM